MYPGAQTVFMSTLKMKTPLCLHPDYETRHGKEFLKNNLVAGSVVLETMVIGRIRGIQFQGIISEPGEDLLSKAKAAYLKRFPVAALMDTRLWVVKLTYIKMTDNRFGFGKKLIWSERPSELCTEASQWSH